MNNFSDLSFFTQPYYRLRKEGGGGLSDAELLAVIISSGSKGENARDTQPNMNNLVRKH